MAKIVWGDGKTCCKRKQSLRRVGVTGRHNPLLFLSRGMRSRRIRHLLSWAIVVIIQIVTFVATTELTFSGYNKDLSLYPPGSYLIQRHQQFGDRGQKKINKVSDDLIPTDLILISSLDGSVRGVDRSTGNVYWTLQGGTSGSSVIRSTIHFRTKHDIRRQRPENSMHDESHAFDDFLMDDSEESSSQEMSVTDDDNADAEGYEMYYIVEPQNGGILYVYGEGRPLEVSECSKHCAYFVVC